MVGLGWLVGVFFAHRCTLPLSENSFSLVLTIWRENIHREKKSYYYFLLSHLPLPLILSSCLLISSHHCTIFIQTPCHGHLTDQELCHVHRRTLFCCYRLWCSDVMVIIALEILSCATTFTQREKEFCNGSTVRPLSWKICRCRLEIFL